MSMNYAITYCFKTGKFPRNFVYRKQPRMKKKIVYFLQIQHSQDLPFLYYWDSRVTDQSQLFAGLMTGECSQHRRYCAGKKTIIFMDTNVGRIKFYSFESIIKLHVLIFTDAIYNTFFLKISNNKYLKYHFL